MFYERLGFTASEPADAAPDGTPRQWYRKRLPKTWSSQV
jgi:hypothetical protein